MCSYTCLLVFPGWISAQDWPGLRTAALHFSITDQCSQVVYLNLFIESTEVLSQHAALQPCNTSTLHRKINAKQHVQSDWCNQGQKCTMESCKRFAAPEIWNNIDGATEQRETGTTGQLERGSFFLLGDERERAEFPTEQVKCWCFQASREAWTPRYTDDSLWLLHV